MKRLILALILALIFIPSLCFGANYSIIAATPFAGYAPISDHHPALLLDYGCTGFSDITGTDLISPSESPDPNVYLGKFECPEEIASQIISDNSYLVLYSEVIQEGRPDAPIIEGKPELTIAAKAIPTTDELAAIAKGLADGYGAVYTSAKNLTSVKSEAGCVDKVCDPAVVAIAVAMSDAKIKEAFGSKTRAEITDTLKGQMSLLPKSDAK